jgi:hypothetical protein
MKTIKAWLVVLAGALLTLGMLPANAAPTPAGTVIGNQATATYNDAGGTPRTTTSNQVTTTVSQVKSFTLNANGARTAAPGQTVYYPHVIQNTGNGTDTYALNAPASSNFAGPTLPHSGLAYYIDADGDGVPDNAVPITTTGPTPPVHSSSSSWRARCPARRERQHRDDHRLRVRHQVTTRPTPTRPRSLLP